MNIAVYLGANYGTNKNINDMVLKVGEYIGKNNHTLVYGASNTGLMLSIAKAVKENNGKIIGIELKCFDEKNYKYEKIDEYHVFDTFLERKKYMMDISEAFIAMPGGVGTLDEITDIISVDKIQDKHHPIIFFNVDNYYADLISLFDKMVTNKYLSQEDRDRLLFISSIDELDKILKEYQNNKD